MRDEDKKAYGLNFLDDDDCPPPCGPIDEPLPEPEPELPLPREAEQPKEKKKVPLLGSSVIGDKTHIVFTENDDAMYAVNCITAFNDNIIGATTLSDWKDFNNIDWQVLAGKTVYFWPDNIPCEDEEERYKKLRKVQTVVKKLKPATKIMWINPEDLEIPEGGSLDDFFQAYDDDKTKIEQLHAVLANAYPLGPSGGVKKLIEQSISGLREIIPLPWPELNRATLALKPGTVTLFCGAPGSSKSFALLQLVQYWHFELGHEVALYELEDDRDYHLMRSLAQTSKEPGLTNENWIKENQERSREIFSENTEFLDILGSMIYQAPAESVTLEHLAEWVNKQAKAGKRIIAIDPITAARAGRETWISDGAFIESAKKSIVEYGASLVIITHPKKGHGKIIDQDSLAGGACWSRFSQTLLWLKNYGEMIDVDILENGCKVEAECNRTVSVLKARNSFGGGRKYAMSFHNLRFSEIGQIVKDKKKRRDDD